MKPKPFAYVTVRAYDNKPQKVKIVWSADPTPEQKEKLREVLGQTSAEIV